MVKNSVDSFCYRYISRFKFNFNKGITLLITVVGNFSANEKEWLFREFKIKY